MWPVLRYLFRSFKFWLGLTLVAVFTITAIVGACTGNPLCFLLALVSLFVLGVTIIDNATKESDA
jgi:hypothetical protein